MDRKKSIYAFFFKRLLDIILSMVALVILCPGILFIAILVRINLGSPVIFIQRRPGKDEKIFSMYKFRTMTDAKDSNGNYLPDKDRLTTFGKFLRSSSLDELPELWNILKGDMSIIGPRPLLVEYLSRYNDEQKRRHDVRPGLTGWAQVNGRNQLSWNDKFKLDTYYCNHVTFLFDMKILFLTVVKVIKRDGISSEDSVTMTEFRGEYENESNEVK